MKRPLSPLPLAAWLLAACVDAAPPAAEATPQTGSRILPRRSQPAGEPTSISDWPVRIAARDGGSKDNAWAKPEFDDRTWKKMVLPVHWEKAGLPNYDGVVWFRRSVQLTAGQARGVGLLSLGAIDDMDVTWVNGVRVGGYEKAGDHFTPRNYKLPAGTLKEGRNLIAVRVMDHGYGGGIAQTHGKMQLTTGGATIPLTGPWHFHKGADLATLIAPTGIPGAPPRPARWKGEFELHGGDVIAFAGGTGMVKQMESGYLEALLTSTTDAQIFFRDIAWQADTVYRRQRPRSFGTQLELLNRINATVIVANYGQMEALEGATRLSAFIAAYETVLDELAQRTPRIVLVPPHSFERPTNPHLPDLSAHNGDVAAYREAIRQLAERRGFLFADVSGFDPAGLTTDGVQHNETGRFAWAQAVASQLTGEEVTLQAGALDPLRKVIARKNALWRQHWRPTNWSFLYGNRQHVPSSHDHRAGQPRWFPVEVDGIIPMIEAEEARIQSLRGQPR